MQLYFVFGKRLLHWGLSDTEREVETITQTNIFREPCIFSQNLSRPVFHMGVIFVIFDIMHNASLICRSDFGRTFIFPGTNRYTCRREL